MRLLYTPIKDYVHTVEAVIAYAGVADRMKPVPTRPFDPENGLAEVNPLITVPALELEDGTPLYGGPVIYEYLDGLHGRDRLFPQDGEAITTRRQLWLADGLFDCTVRLIIEGWVPQEQQRPDVLERYWAKIGGTLDALTRDAAAWRSLDIAQARAVGALSFLGLKTSQISDATGLMPDDYDWRDGRKPLAAWYKRTAADPIFHFNLLPSD